MKWDVKLRDGDWMHVEADVLYSEGGALVFERNAGSKSKPRFETILVVAPQTYLHAVRMEDTATNASGPHTVGQP